MDRRDRVEFLQKLLVNEMSQSNGYDITNEQNDGWFSRQSKSAHCKDRRVWQDLPRRKSNNYKDSEIDDEEEVQDLWNRLHIDPNHNSIANPLMLQNIAKKLLKWEGELREQETELSNDRRRVTRQVRDMKHVEHVKLQLDGECVLVQTQLEAERKRLEETLVHVARYNQHIEDTRKQLVETEAKLKAVNGKLERGQKQLQRVSISVVADTNTKQNEQKDNECPVCSDTYDFEDEDKDNEVITTLCGHSMHRKCLGNWLVKQNSCPLCRSEIL